MSKKFNRFIGLLFLVLMLFTVIATASATCNVIVITDPTCEDPNGAAAGSMSFANNMFQSSFIMSKNDGYAMLSGGEGNGTERNYAIIDALGAMQHGSSPAAAAAGADPYAETVSHHHFRRPQIGSVAPPGSQRHRHRHLL